MDEHGVALDLRQTCTNRVRPLGAAFDQLADSKASEGCRRHFLLSFADDHPRGFHCSVMDQRLDRPAQHGLAAEYPVLLGQAATGAFALSGGNDERNSGHGAGL
jgi:hypothetical protein